MTRRLLVAPVLAALLADLWPVAARHGITADRGAGVATCPRGPGRRRSRSQAPVARPEKGDDMNSPPGCHYDPDESAPAWCSCPVKHPRLARLLAPISWLLPGRVMTKVLGDLCWADAAAAAQRRAS